MGRDNGLASTLVLVISILYTEIPKIRITNKLFWLYVST